MAYDAELSKDKQIGVETLVESQEGVVGLRTYITNTQEAYQSLFLCGVPKRGDPWASTLPTLRVVNRAYEYWGGGDDKTLDPPTGGRSLVRLRYETPSLRGYLAPPRANLAFTRLRPAVETLTVYYGVNNGSGPSETSRPINSGDGTSKKRGRVGADIYHYLDAGSQVNLPRLLDAMDRQLLSSTVLKLPPLEDGGPPLTLPAFQVQYETFDLGMKDGLVEVVHHVQLGQDFGVVWTEADKLGNAAVAYIADIYEAGDLRGLWPGSN